jgi:hypothetical protein
LQDGTYVHYETQCDSTKQQTLAAVPETANDFLEALSLETNQLDYVGMLNHWKVYTFIDSSTEERCYVYASVTRKYTFNCMYEVQLTKKRLSEMCLFGTEYVFE